MKGIVLAGGKGTRLSPLTIAVSKQLLPVYDKPMIYYPINTLVNAGIKEILIITTPEDQSLFKKLLGAGEMFNCSFDYAVQENPGGIAEAFIIGEKFIGTDFVTLILGDNIFHGAEFSKALINIIKTPNPTIFAIECENVNQYGVVEINNVGDILSIEEKPFIPKSNFAVPGLYIYNSNVVSVAKKLTPSKRGEKEITDIHNSYLSENNLTVTILPKDTLWMDAGTPDNLLEVSNKIKKNSLEFPF